MDHRDSYDVIIVGAGVAGLTAANFAAAAGRSVLVVEAGPEGDYPCNSRIATGALGVAHRDVEDDPDRLYAAIMDDTENYAWPSLARMHAKNAGRAFAFLREAGAPLVKSELEGKRRWIMQPPRSKEPGLAWKNRGPDATLSALGRRLAENGGRILFNSRARALIMETERCAGARIEIDGRTREIRSRAVVLADGGFQANPELVREHVSPAPEKLVQRNAGTGHGDCLRMAELVGARATGLSAFYGHLLAQEAFADPRFWPYPTLDSLASSSIVVGPDGRRFVDEGLGGIPLSNIIARLPDPRSATAVFDERIWEDAGRVEHVAANPWLTKMGAIIHSAPTIAELADALGLDRGRLVETVDCYNSCVEARRLDELDPPRTLGRSFGSLRSSPARLPVYPLQQPPFRAIRLCAGITYTLGGLEIDDEARAIGPGGSPIVGLFAAGSCTGGLEGGPIAGYIGGYMKAVCTGMVAGESAARASSRP